jgi:HEAT repeat protein
MPTLKLQMASEAPLQMAAEPEPGTPVDQMTIPGLEALIAELTNADPAVRYRAVLELGKVQDARAIPILYQRLSDDEDGVRKAAAEVIENLGWQPADAGQQAWHSVILRRWDHAVAAGPDAVDSLVYALQAFDPGSQRFAAESLGKIRDARAVEPLLEKITSTDFGIRKAVVVALGEIGDARALPALMEAMNDKFKVVRDAAEQAIAKVG